MMSCWRVNTGILVSFRRYLLRTYTNVSNRPMQKWSYSSYHVCHNYRSNKLLDSKCLKRTCTNTESCMFSSDTPTEELDQVAYEGICEETLDSLCEFFEDIIDRTPIFKTADVSFGDGVLTVNLESYGIYVINRQSPNKQIWLSSPLSGPKRYDFVASRNGWVYRHDNKTLHGLLQEELSSIVKNSVDLSNCAYCGDLNK